MNENSISAIIQAYNEFLFRDGSLSEHYFQLSQLQIKKIQDYEKMIRELQGLMEEKEILQYVSSVPLTFNQQRIRVEKIDFFDRSKEEVLLRFYGKIYDICHHAYSQLRKVKEVSRSLIESLQRLQETLTIVKRIGRNTIFNGLSHLQQNAQVASQLLSYSKINIIEICMSFPLHDHESAKAIQALLNKVKF